MPLLTPNFSLNELSVTSQVDENGRPIVNRAGDTETLYLRLLCETILEGVRVLWGCPVAVSSGFRCEEVERKVQRRPAPLPLHPSQHRRGQAADISPAGPLDLDEAYRRIFVSGLPFDQLLFEEVDGKRWIHISCAPIFAAPRRQALTTTDGVSWAEYKPPSNNGEGIA